MTGEKIIEGLEGLSKIDGISDVLFSAIYWLAVLFVMLFVAYIFVSISIYISKKKRGVLDKNKDDFLDD